MVVRDTSHLLTPFQAIWNPTWGSQHTPSRPRVWNHLNSNSALQYELVKWGMDGKRCYCFYWQFLHRLMWLIIVLQADIYTDSSGACAAFISNVDDKNDKKVVFRNASYHLPAWSVSILPDCKNVVFNTAKVGYLCFLFTHSNWHISLTKQLYHV